MKSLKWAIAPMFIIILWAFKHNPSPKSEGMVFAKSYQAALKEAKASHKPIFVDIYAVWCGPCKRLKATTFHDPKVVQFYNENFINITLDGEKGEGKKLAERIQLRAYPTLAFLDENGNLILKDIGFKSPEEFIALGQKAVK